MAALSPALDEGVRLRVRLGLAEDLIGALRARELDVVLATTRVRARGVTYEALYDEELMLVAGERWAARIPARAIRTRGAAALADVPLLAYAEHLPLLKRYWRVVFGARLSRTPQLVAPDLRLLSRAVVAGAGVTVLPSYLVEPLLSRRELTALATPDEVPRNRTFLACHSPTMEEARVALVCELLRRAAPTW